jgi:RNA polymerase sigma-70 factor (ECF subfamily)
MSEGGMPPGPVLETFERHRPLLFSIAYRMLGNASDAEDAVRESYLRWLRANSAAERDPRSPKAYLSAAMVRLCLDRLGVGPSRREEHAAGLDASLSMAFLVTLESLTPTERAVPEGEVVRCGPAAPV